MLPTGGPSPNPIHAGLLAAVAGLTLLVGAALFALPPTAEPPLPRQVGAAAAAMVVWSYCEGVFGRRDWGMAALEGLLLTKVALHWTALLLEAFGAHWPRGAVRITAGFSRTLARHGARRCSG